MDKEKKLWKQLVFLICLILKLKLNHKKIRLTNLSSSVIPAGQDAKGSYLGRDESLSSISHYVCDQ